MDCQSVTPKRANSLFIVTALAAILTGPTSAPAQGDDGVAALRRAGRTFAAIAEKASPAVVVLKIEGPTPPESSEARRRRGWMPDGRGRIELDDGVELPEGITDTAVVRRRTRPAAARRSRGLGFIVSKDGFVLTNHHIVDGATKVTAELADGRDFRVRIVGADPTIDVAVLKIDADKLPALKLGDADAPGIGDWVVGITNSMGMGRTFSAGMVTAKGRGNLGMAAIENYVQTDIILHPGDAGGPLLDLDGEVAGISTAIVGREQGLGISLAIPVNMVKSAYEQIIETGKVERGFLGVAFTDIDARSAKALRLETTSGVMVSGVAPDSAASRAGVEKYDVVAKFNTVPIESGPQFLHLVASLRPGKVVELVVIRDGEPLTLTVTLGERPSGRLDAPKDD